MDKSIVKEEILKHQVEVVEHLEEAIKDFHAEADLDEDDTIDPEDRSHQDEATDMELRLKEQLKIAQHDLNLLEGISLDAVSDVRVGSLINTDRMVFYVGISSLPFQLENKTVVGISTNAPIYYALMNKKTGDTITVANTTYSIESIA